jgi:hypothetical protein
MQRQLTFGVIRVAYEMNESVMPWCVVMATCSANDAAPYLYPSRLNTRQEKARALTHTPFQRILSHHLSRQIDARRTTKVSSCYEVRVCNLNTTR